MDFVAASDYQINQIKTRTINARQNVDQRASWPT